MDDLTADPAFANTMVVAPAEHIGWETLATVRQRIKRAVLVALVPRLDISVIIRARRFGVNSMVECTAAVEKIVETAWMALRGYVPVELLAVTQPAPRPVPSLTSEELQWLDLLSAGRTVREIAILTNRSYGDLKRKLGALYRKLEVHTAREAIAYSTGRTLPIERLPSGPSGYST